METVALKLGNADVGLNVIAKGLCSESLTSRRVFNDVDLIYKLIFGQLISPPKLSRKINF